MDVKEARKMAGGAIERLAEELDRGESETLRRYLAAMGRFHRYSLRNQMLIAEQRETPRTCVASGLGSEWDEACARANAAS